MNKHVIYESVDGHEWCKPGDLIKHDYCKRCLKIRRADKRNPPCKGPSKLREMEKFCEKAGESILNQFAPGKPLREFGIPPRIVELLTKYCNVFIVEDLLMLEPGDIDGLKLNAGDRNILEGAIWEAAMRH